MSYQNIDFIKAYADGRHYEIGCAEKAMILLLPFVMMDVAYDTFRKEVKPLPLKHRAKMLRNQWTESYKRFNRHFFDTLDPDMADAFCDKMDSFKRFIYLDMVNLQGKFMRCLPETASKEEKQSLSSIMLVNRIAHLANEIWVKCYLINGRFSSSNAALNGCVTYSAYLCMEMAKSVPGIKKYEEGENERQMWKTLEAFQDKCLDFVKYDMNVA